MAFEYKNIIPVGIRLPNYVKNMHEYVYVY